MPEYKDWSLDHLEAEYRSSLDEYERDAAKMRSRVLDLKRRATGSSKRCRSTTGSPGSAPTCPTTRPKHPERMRVRRG
jgi:hypothetical protein